MCVRIPEMKIGGVFKWTSEELFGSKYGTCPVQIRELRSGRGC